MSYYNDSFYFLGNINGKNFEGSTGIQSLTQHKFGDGVGVFEYRLAYEALLPSKSGKGVAVKAPIGGFVKNCDAHASSVEQTVVVLPRPDYPCVIDL